MARVSKMARGKNSFASGTPFCLKFYSSASLYCKEYADKYTNLCRDCISITATLQPHFKTSVVIIHRLRRWKLVAGVRGLQSAFTHAATFLVHYVPVYVQYIFTFRTVVTASITLLTIFVSNMAFTHLMSKSGTPKCKLSEKSKIANENVL
jgi:hypothetical protein